MSEGFPGARRMEDRAQAARVDRCRRPIGAERRRVDRHAERLNGRSSANGGEGIVEGATARKIVTRPAAHASLRAIQRLHTWGIGGGLVKETKKCAIPSSSPVPSCLRLLFAAGSARQMHGLAYITRPTSKELASMGDTLDTPVPIARFR
jgi:hypothetical protein